MSEPEIRLECLKQAIAAETGDPVELARVYADFVLGRKDSEIVEAAKELSRRVTA